MSLYARTQWGEESRLLDPVLIAADQVKAELIGTCRQRLNIGDQLPSLFLWQARIAGHPMPTITVSDQPLQFASARGMDLFCLQRRMVPFAFSVGAVASSAFVCIDLFACSQGLRAGSDRILPGTIALWNLRLPIANG